MRIGLRIDFINLLKLSCLYRAIAILFLILIFIDIASPEVCCEELAESSEDVPVLQTFVMGENFSNNHNHSITSSPVQKDEHSKCTTNNEGCFCCCAHFLISKSLSIQIPFLNSLSVNKFSLEILLSPPIANVFHPPRLT